MSLIDTLSTFFSRPAEETAGETPEGMCANCWGHYEYDGEVRQVARDRQVDVNNQRARHAFIRDFVVTHVDGVRLRDTGCPKCTQVVQDGPRA